MKILVSGASGLIGRNLVQFLEGKGYDVYKIVRVKSLEDARNIYWDYEKREYDIERFEGFDVYIHLAGESILGLWTKKKKQKIRDSRVVSTTILGDIIANLKKKPNTFICASAIGIYGDRGDEILTENSGSGKGFLADVCKEWEASAMRVEDLGIRVSMLRTGIVLDKKGGALKSMLLPFRLGFGAILGDGNQFWSWISIKDEVRAICHLIEKEDLSGPFNLVSPQPVTNRVFAHTLSKVLKRSCFLRIPKLVIEAALGQFGREMFLNSTRVIPERLMSSGFEFSHIQLESTLKELLFT